MYHKAGVSAYKEGLENIETLANITGHPEKKFRSIHIAGTNGKGSTAHFIASWFQELGYKTGLYTSPHLIDFRERIRINGEMIAEADVVRFFERFQEQLTHIEPSFFEITTILAFDYFAQQQVDVAIVEVGLGGRLDATNIVMPELSVITSISLDHTQLLGQAIAQIAAEKGGIIKPGVPVVIGEYQSETLPVFQALAHKQKTKLWLAEERYAARKHKSAKTQKDEGIQDDTVDVFRNNILLYSNIKIPLQGDYQLKNVVTFLQAVEILTPVFNPKQNDVTQAAIENMVHNTHLSGRWQQLATSPLTICDVGHNVGGLALTMRQLLTIPHRQLHFVVGFVNDKDIAHILNLLPREAYYYLCCANIERALPLPQLAGHFAAAALRHAIYNSVTEAFNAAQAAAQSDDLIFIGGSCFVVGEVL
jgi:dihydrofolate synthase/folylpolyglutamate synthase